MARPHEPYQSQETPQPPSSERSDYSAARMLTAAATALLVSLLVMNSTKGALYRERTDVANRQPVTVHEPSVELDGQPRPSRAQPVDRQPADEKHQAEEGLSQPRDGEIEPAVSLTDDDNGESMFESQQVSPGSPEVECIAVSYRGGTPAVVRMNGVSYGSLATQLQLTIERGAGGGFGSCRGFTSEEMIYQGTLARFTRQYSSVEGGLQAFIADASPFVSTFKVVVELDGRSVSPGDSASAQFLWSSSS